MAGRRIRTRTPCGLVLTMLLLSGLGGCSVIDRVDRRATVMNEAISENNNKGILVNLARSSLAEPLSFSALTSYQGHNTITGSFAYPSFTEATNQLRIQGLSVSGPSTGGTLGTDFNFVGYDDTATYTPLLRPIEPLTLALFIKQEYNKELLYYLAFQDIRVTRKGALVDDFPNEPITRSSQPNKDGKLDFARFGDRLQELVQAGLTFQLGTDNASTRVCFQATKSYYPTSVRVRAVEFAPACGDVLAPLQGPKKGAFRSAYRVRDLSDGTDWDISLRSVFGIYRYLGVAIAQGARLRVLGDPAEQDPFLIRLTDADDDCFVQETYRRKTFCVPNDAYTTKRVFTILHDLVKLSTPSSPAPQPTVTARTIGGT